MRLPVKISPYHEGNLGGFFIQLPGISVRDYLRHLI
jgi:hypothetical protein